jgi:hypothetical protein
MRNYLFICLPPELSAGLHERGTTALPPYLGWNAEGDSTGRSADLRTLRA